MKNILKLLVFFIAVSYSSTLYALKIFITQPKHYYVCSGSSEKVVFALSGTSMLSYQWQMYNAVTGVWGNMTNILNQVSGVTTASLTLTPSSAWPTTPVKYRCRYTYKSFPFNETGDSETAEVRIFKSGLIIDNPVISSTNPVCAGSNITVSIKADGSNLQYQWYEDAALIGGATSSAYSYTRTYPNTTKAIKCRLTKTCVTSLSYYSAAVNEPTILQAPIITSQPSATKAGCEGTYVSMSLGANGAGTLTYTWKKNNFDISPVQNSSSCVFNPANTTHSGSYTCYISQTGNSCVVTSSVCALTINQNIAVTQHPLVSQEVGVGGTVSFQCTATGTVNAYRWQKWNGATWDNMNDVVNSISGTATTVLTLSNVTPGTTTYRCFVDGACNDVNSNSAVLIVTTKPAITVHPQNQNTCLGSNSTFSITASNALSYRWEQSTTNGNSWDSVGTNSSSLTVPVSNVNQTGYLYKCIAKGNGGNTISDIATLSVKDPVTIITQPLAKNKCVNDSSSLMVKATGSDLSYKWYKNASAEGSLDDSLIYASLQTSDQGNYYCAVTGYCGTVNTSTVLLKVDTLPWAKNLGNDTTICWKQKVTIDAGVFASYLWNTGQTLQTIEVDSAHTYSVVVSNANGCKATASKGVNVIKPFDSTTICMVTYDSASGKNRIIWDRKMDKNIQSYEVFRLEGLGYQSVGTKNFDELSVIIDNGSTPAIKSYKYVVVAVDSCNNKSTNSPTVQTMLLQASKGTETRNANLSWTPYDDKSENFAPSYYYIWRGKTKTSMQLLDSVSGGSAPSYIDTAFDGISAYYKLEIRKPSSCYPAILKAESGPYSQSLSNIAEYKTTSIESINEIAVSVFPNPIHEAFKINYTLETSGDVAIQITDMTGRRVFESLMQEQYAGENSIELSSSSCNMTSGMYNIKIISGEKISVIKCIIEK